MRYALTRISTGEIIQEGTCPEDAFEKQGRKLADGSPDPDISVKEVPDDLQGDLCVEYCITAAGALRKRSMPQIAARQQAVDDCSKPAPGAMTKLERILVYLKNQGIDLGPDGADL